MADDANKIILKTNDKPTMLNRDMLLYGILAPVAVTLLVTTPIALLAPGAAPALAAASSYIWYVSVAAGGLLGGVIGKRNIEKANTEGKEAKSPSFLNKKLFISGWLGAVAFGL
ncbi:MAG: hypothetical protein KGJ21_03905, partial [Pseudomonadota bacterium]|nr:hypothetical protein [Pseudomonadota bacterium]